MSPRMIRISHKSNTVIVQNETSSISQWKYTFQDQQQHLHNNLHIYNAFLY